jgi:hypothetical protein
MRRALLALLTLAAPGMAQEIPACTQDRVGAAACMSGKLCSCGYQRGGSVSGRPDGYRWDCGALRPACGEAAPPAGIGMTPAWPMPELYLQLQPPAPPIRR